MSRLADRAGAAAAAWLLGRAARWSVPHRREWIEAMRGELPEVRGPGARLSWALGAARLALSPGGRRRLDWLFWPCLLTACAGVLWMDLSPSDDAGQATLALLLLASAGLGFGWPRRAWAAGLIAGCCLAIAHLAYVVLGVRLPYRMEPSGATGALTLLVLLVPALLAAVGAGWTRRALSRAPVE